MSTILYRFSQRHLKKIRVHDFEQVYLFNPSIGCPCHASRARAFPLSSHKGFNSIDPVMSRDEQSFVFRAAKAYIGCRTVQDQRP